MVQCRTHECHYTTVSKLFIFAHNFANGSFSCSAILLKSMSIKYVRDYVLNKYRTEVAIKTRGQYPAPSLVLDAVEASFTKDVDAAFDHESHLFANIAQTPEAKSLVSLFNRQSDCKQNIYLSSNDKEKNNLELKVCYTHINIVV